MHRPSGNDHRCRGRSYRNASGGHLWGNPTKPICTIEEYYERRKKKQLNEACIVYTAYRRRFGKEPGVSLFHEYFYLFTHGDDELRDAFRNKLRDKGNEGECLDYLRSGKNEPLFESYEDFRNYVAETLVEGM